MTSTTDLELKLNPRILCANDHGLIQDELRRIGVSEQGLTFLQKKANFFLLKLHNLNRIQCNILKQTMLSAGGDVAVHKHVLDEKIDTSSVILIGNQKHFEYLFEKLTHQPWELALISEVIKNAINNYHKQNFHLDFPDKTIELGKKTLIMGVLNVTPDSFSDGGEFLEKDKAVEHAISMWQSGADIIDVGGESTRPGSDPVPEEQEIQRTIPVIRELKRNYPQIKISIDTYKAKVAEMAIEAGACLVNDVSALRGDPRMVEVVARHKLPVVLMHMKGTPKNMQDNPTYDELLSEIIGFLRERIYFATTHGVGGEKIIIDPGIGFGKQYHHNLQLISQLSEFRVLGRPIMIGPSRKRFIGHYTGKDVKYRLYGTIASVVSAILNGASIVRVHDVAEIRDAVIIADLLKNKVQSYEN